jgi:hypothetical protein
MRQMTLLYIDYRGIKLTPVLFYRGENFTQYFISIFTRHLAGTYHFVSSAAVFQHKTAYIDSGGFV